MVKDRCPQLMAVCAHPLRVVSLAHVGRSTWSAFQMFLMGLATEAWTTFLSGGFA